MDPEPKLNVKSEPDQEKIVMDPQHCYESKSSGQRQEVIRLL
jgi:hypothetical protein